MQEFQTFQVFPKIPKPLSFLEELSRNLWWCWKRNAIDLFRRIDPNVWEASGRNPIVFLTQIPQGRFEELSGDDSFLAHLQMVKDRFKKRILSPLDFSNEPFGPKETIAYFSMEFGLHESIPLFAGGLGVLAGDLLKAASGLRLPLTGVGLLYRKGYFKQYLDQDGMQQENYPETNVFHLPVERAKNPKGNEVRITITGPHGIIHAIVWKLMVGRIPLYLLDTNLLENPPHIRDITAKLYAGDDETRLAQEVLLGIGGIRALTALGIYPKVCHMNEGHSAFSSIERLALAMSTYNIDLRTALEIVPRSTVFTTHTPVAAGHDEFPVEMVRPYLMPFVERLSATEKRIISWGQPLQPKGQEPFSMFILGIRMSQYCNGVSKLHGNVARLMWSHVWPDKPIDEIPITHVTNGIHISTWISPENTLLFERYLGPEWHVGSRKSKNTARINDIFDEELWRAHEISRSRLIRLCREQMVQQYGKRYAPKTIMKDAEMVLDQDALTIGFARRFATYKRATLLLQDPDRLEAILSSDKYPVQIIFAGKAHPKDDEGKEYIRKVVEFARRPKVRQRIIFLENYDMHLARHMLHGVDIWLNTPRRPFEACGTSGMKAAINGALNVSILDGWWAEAYSGNVGWRIGEGDELSDTKYQDTVESQALYNVLENEVIPSFYNRKNGDAPTQWIQMMKASMQMAMQNFCGFRMARDYKEKFYDPGAKRFDDIVSNNAEKSKQLAARFKRIYAKWKSVRINPPIKETLGRVRVGEEFHVNTKVYLGDLSPEEVNVQLYYGHLKSLDQVLKSRHKTMDVTDQLGNGEYLYTCKINCGDPGRYGFTARVIPRGDEFLKNMPGFITWA